MKNSILIDRQISDIPFTPNIYASVEKLINHKKIKALNEFQFTRNLNDSIKVFYEIGNTSPGNKRIGRIIWLIKYEKMTSEDILFLLAKYEISLYDKYNYLRKNLLGEKESLFWNQNLNQFFIGRYSENEKSFYINYYYPTTYCSFWEKSSFERSLKQRFIGPPF